MRLNRGGDRQANAAIYRVAIFRARDDDRTKEPLINRASVLVFPDHGDPGLISAIVDRFQCYFWGINACLDPFQAQFTRHA